MKILLLSLLLLQLIFEVLPGSSLELPCAFSQPDLVGAPITWKFNGEDISTSDSTRVKKDGLYLFISPVTVANEGTYMCSVKQNNMEIVRTYDIKVVALTALTIIITEGLSVNLPCHFPASSQVTADTRWFKETSTGQRTWLNPGDNSTGFEGKFELLYPGDHDQSLLLRDAVMEDFGMYHCESAEGQRMSTIVIKVEVAPTAVPFTCGGFNTAWESCQDENSRTGEPMLQESMAEFSMKLYSHLRESQPSSNILFSPISISGAMSYLLLGARDDTRRAIERAVCVPHDFHCVHFQLMKMREKLSSSLQMASQIFYNPKMNLSESFTTQSIQYYEAEPVKLLESMEDSKLMINSWVANKTNNKIKHLVDSVSPNTQLILLNAVSFTGQWKVKFQLKPKKGFFTKLDGDMVKVPVLYHNKYMISVSYVDELSAQVARFALTGDSSLYIILPRSSSVTDLQHVEERMTDTAVRQMIEQMKTTTPQGVEVTLPQIKLDTEPDMNILLKKLGLSSLFEGPNLCGLYPDGQLVLDEARHRAFLTLTEQGVEAGAVTSLSFSRSFLSFSALRPFILLLWSDQANVPLFIGRVTDP